MKKVNVLIYRGKNKVRRQRSRLCAVGRSWCADKTAVIKRAQGLSGAKPLCSICLSLGQSLYLHEH